MMNERELIEEMARILDGCIPLLEKAAETEARQEAGKTLRKVTHQKRLNMATRLLTIADGLKEAIQKADAAIADGQTP